MNKGELMKVLYSKEELRHIDAGIPKECWKGRNTYYFVMNYNDSGAFGKLEDMRDIAKERELSHILEN